MSLRVAVHKIEFNVFLTNKVWTTLFTSSPPAKYSNCDISATAGSIDLRFEAFESWTKVPPFYMSPDIIEPLVSEVKIIYENFMVHEALHSKIRCHYGNFNFT